MNLRFSSWTFELPGYLAKAGLLHHVRQLVGEQPLTLVRPGANRSAPNTILCPQCKQGH